MGQKGRGQSFSSHLSLHVHTPAPTCRGGTGCPSAHDRQIIPHETQCSSSTSPNMVNTLFKETSPLC